MGGQRGRTAAASALLLALTLIVLDSRGEGIAGPLRAAAAGFLGPAQEAVAKVGAPLRAAGAGNPDAAAQAATAAELREQVQVLRKQLGTAARGQLQAEAAAELAALAPPSGYRPVATEVVALAGPLELSLTVVVAAGSADGVQVGSAVISPTGLVGLVDTVGPSTATVRLLADRGTRISARIAASSEMGLFHGSGTPEQGWVELLDPLGQMSAGDLVVTLGSPDGAPLPTGLPLGRISKITGSAATMDRRGVVATAVDASTLDAVMVLVPDPGVP